MPDLATVVAASVRGERSRRRWRQQDLADRMRWSQATVSDIEAGKRVVTVADLVGLCAALEISLADLFRGADPDDLRTLGANLRNLGDMPPARNLSDIIAAGIRAERARRGWTQAQLAERAGLSRNTVGDIEARKRTVTVDYLLTFCKALGVPASILLQGATIEDLRALGL